MRIEFGWSLDGAAWADGAGARGAARMGPRSLVQLLQNRLGLTRPAVEPAVRVAQYVRLFEEHLASLPDPSAFWPARSFAVDPWSTERQLLRWRDEAVATGWRPSGVEGPLPERLAALRDLERTVVVGTAGTLAPSPADDLAELIALLEGDAATWPLGIEEVALHEPPERLPGRWPHLFSLLTAAGVDFPVLPAPEAGAPALTVVEALDEWSAADVAARYLAAPASPEDGPLTVLAARGTDVLDRALHRRGLPAIGHVEPSTDRAHHQVLGLFLDVATAPVDVHQLAALLDLRVLPGADGDAEPVGLVPAAARRRLLRALGREPGVGGPAWQEALGQIAADGPAPAIEAARAVDRMVTEPLPAEGLRPDLLSARLDWLVERLRAVARGEGELLATLTQVRTLQQVLGMLDPAAPLARRTLQQVIDSCGGSGPSPRAVREVADWAVTTRPAQLRAAGGTVLWWGPSAEELPAAERWDTAEAAALEAGGGRVLDPAAVASLQVDAALAGLRGVRRVIAVLPGPFAEEAPGPSGLLAHLEAAAGAERLSPESLIDGDTWSLAGRTLPVTTPVEEHGDPVPPLERRIAPAPHLLPERLSYTQAASLLACPQHWALEYALDVRPAEVAALPTGARMIGTLVHAVVETLVHEHAHPTPEQIGATFDALVPQLASELDLPGRAAERSEVRERAVRSLGALFRGLADAGLRITGTESRFSLPLTLPLAAGPHTVTFVGSRDVDAVDAQGRPSVLDLKWSRSRTRYGDLFDTGEAIQLAAYAWTVAQEQSLAEPAGVGYFLLRSGEFVSADPALDPRRRTPMDVEDAWSRMLAGITTVLDEVAAGTVRAGCRALIEEAGLDAGATWAQHAKAVTAARATARAAGGLLVEDHCAGSEYAQLCGLTGDRR